MKKTFFFAWVKIVMALLSLFGMSGCIFRGFSCVYGGPPEAYETEENSEPEIEETESERQLP